MNRKTEYGGEYARGKRKSSRPLSTTKSHHVVLRANAGVISFLRKERRDLILRLIQTWAEHFQVRVYAQSINSNHVHLVLYGKSLSSLHGFLRVCPGQIAQRLGNKEPSSGDTSPIRASWNGAEHSKNYSSMWSKTRSKQLA